jgi:hypothetical protein
VPCCWSSSAGVFLQPAINGLSLIVRQPQSLFFPRRERTVSTLTHRQPPPQRLYSQKIRRQSSSRLSCASCFYCFWCGVVPCSTLRNLPRRLRREYGPVWFCWGSVSIVVSVPVLEIPGVALRSLDPWLRCYHPAKLHCFIREMSNSGTSNSKTSAMNAKELDLSQSAACVGIQTGEPSTRKPFTTTRHAIRKQFPRA